MLKPDLDTLYEQFVRQSIGRRTVISEAGETAVVSIHSVNRTQLRPEVVLALENPLTGETRLVEIRDYDRRIDPPEAYQTVDYAAMQLVTLVLLESLTQMFKTKSE